MVELAVPEDALGFDPLRGLFDGLRADAAAMDAALLSAFDESGRFEDAEVTRDGRGADFVWLGEFADRGLAAAESLDDAASDGIGEGAENGVEIGGAFLGHTFLRRAASLNHVVNYMLFGRLGRGENPFEVRRRACRDVECDELGDVVVVEFPDGLLQFLDERRRGLDHQERLGFVVHGIPPSVDGADARDDVDAGG